MPTFSYRAVDRTGVRKSGLIEAQGGAAARQALRARGLLPLDLAEAGEAADAPTGPKLLAVLNWRRGLPVRTLALVTRQLSTLLGAGLRIDDALATVARAQDTRVSALLLALRREVQEGRTFAEALGTMPHVFPSVFRASVRAGEEAGRLERVTALMAEHLEGRAANRQTVVLALLYPVLLAAVSLTIILMLMIFVVPDIVRVFSTRGADLPFLTRALIGLSGALVEFGGLLLAVLVATAVISARLLASESRRESLDRLLAQAAGTRRLVRELNATQFAVTLATLLKSNVQLADALATSSAVVSNRFIRSRIRDIGTQVRQGRPLGASMEEAGIFPAMMVAMVASGESSGTLADALDRAATEQRRSLDAFVRTAAGLVEPLILLVMGGLVMLMVLAILLPILSLNGMTGIQ